MITLIHGDDITASRNYYLLEREKAKEKRILDGRTVAVVDVMQVLSGNGLFGDQESIFIEELISKRKSSKEIEELVAVLSEQQEATIYFWESKTLTPKQIGLFKNAHVKEFKIPIIVWNFLDNIKPGNTVPLLKLYHELVEQQDPMYALTMIIRQVRILLALLDSSQPTISEITRISSWQKPKLEKQAKLFTKDQLLLLHRQLFQIEYGQKTGTLATSLSSTIDFLLASI